MSLKTKICLLWGVVLSAVGAVVGFFWLLAGDYFGKLPSIEELQNPFSLISSEIYSEDGVLLGKYYQKDRLSTKYSDISHYALDALIATEDERFYSHSGIDFRSLGRAIFGVLTFNQKGGASTISQQLALNLLVELNENNRRSKSKWQRIIQKFKEWVVALKLERNFTKQEIIALYLNTVPFSDNVYGIKNAAQTFFQCHPLDLTLDQAAVLIGSLKGNTLYNPRKNPRLATIRRNVVIDQMYQNGFITFVQAAQAKRKPIGVRYMRLDEQAGIATYFREIVREDVKNLLKNKRKSNGQPYDIYRDGLKIYTTIDSKMQTAAETAVERQLSTLQTTFNAQSYIKTGEAWRGRANVLFAQLKQTPRYKTLSDVGFTDEEIFKKLSKKIPMRVFSWRRNHEVDTVMSPIDSIKYHQQFLQSGFMAMDPYTGFVKAWVGGANYKYFKYDHVNIHTKRPVGSAIKPLLYTLAIVDLGYHTNTMCPNVDQCFPEYDNWCSHNDDNAATDNVPLWKGLASSLNNVSAYLIKKVSVRRFVEFLRSANIQSDLPAVPSLCLGTPDISLFEMVWAYSMFPAKGYSVKPVYIKRIEDKNGNIIKTFTTEKKYVISATDDYMMVQMLKQVIDVGTGFQLRSRYSISGEVAGKTGTTNANADAWFMGFTPNLVVGVWVGCDLQFLTLATSAGYGSSAAMPIFARFMKDIEGKRVSLDTSLKTFVMPAGYHEKIRLNNVDNQQRSPTNLPTNQTKTQKTKKSKNLYLR